MPSSDKRITGRTTRNMILRLAHGLGIGSMILTSFVGGGTAALAAPVPTVTPPTATATLTATPTATDTAASATPAGSATATASETATDLSVTSTPTDTETATPAASDTVTPTASASATESAMPSETETATATDTQSATASPTPSSTANITDTATPTLTATSTLTATPTATVTAAASPTVTPTATLTATPPVTGTPPFDLNSLIPDGLARVTATRDPNDGSESAVVDDSGAAASFMGGRVLVIAEGGTFGQGVRLVLHPHPVLSFTQDVISDTTGIHIDPISMADAPLGFDIENVGLQDGQTVRQFNKPVRIIFDLRGLDSRATSHNWYIAYQDPADPSLWHRMPVITHDDTGVISTETGHFSNYVAAPDGSQWQWHWEPPAGDAFSGAATYRYPIAVPPARGGMTPNIDISYSSRGVDGLLASSNDEGPLGLGWQIENIQITRNGDFMQDDGANLRWQAVGDFSLLINSQAYKLVTSDNPLNATVRYYARNAPQLFIQRIYDASATGTNPDKIYWIVKTPDGTIYRMGFTADSEIGQQYWFTDMLGENTGADSTYTGIRWQVDTITDVNGNQVQYDYAVLPHEGDGYTKTGRNGGTLTTDKSRLQDIRYNFVNQAASFSDRQPATDAQSQIVFSGTVDGRRMQQIQLFNNGDLVNPYQLITLGLDSVTHAEDNTITDRVTSIREQNGDGTQSLPATTIGYTAYAHSSGNCCWLYDYVTQIDNGYGGRTQLSYASDQRNDLGATWYLTQTKTFPNAGGAPSLASITTYQYQTPCYDQADGDVGVLAGAFDCPDHDNYGGIFGNSPYAHGTVVGFMTTTVTTKDYDGVTTLSQNRSQFYQAPVEWIGKPFQQQALDPVTGSVLQQTDTAYASTSNGATTFLYTSAVTNTVFSAGGSQHTSTRDYYETSNQGGLQYGNLTKHEEYDSAGSLYRCTLQQYYPNGTNWIVNKPAVNSVYNGTCTGTGTGLASSTRYVYNSTSTGDNAVMPDNHGLLLAQRRWQGDGALNQFADTRYLYDAYGNVTYNKSYPTVGSASLYSTGVPEIVTTTYDSTYHLLPITVTNALGQPSVLGYDLTFARPMTFTAPTGAVSSYRYDAFGRLTSVARPGDTVALPTVAYQYTDGYSGGGLQGLRVLEVDQEQSGVSGANRPLYKFYDGLGRPVEERDETVNGSQQDVTKTGYDALGRAISATVPAFGSYLTDYYAPNWPSETDTNTRYDALGRAVRVTAPDGTNTDTIYGKLSQYHQDGNGHVTISYSDDFGRTNVVDEAPVSWNDNFAVNSSGSYTVSGSVTWAGGDLSIVGDGSGTDYIRRKPGANLADGNGVVVSFKVDTNAATADTVVIVRANGYGTSAYRRWGISVVNGEIYRETQLGTGALDRQPLMAAKTGVWYRALLKIGGSSQYYIATVWERDNPAVSAERREDLSSSYDGNHWEFQAQVFTDTLEVDNLDEVAYNRTTYTYDVLNQLTLVTDALGHTTRMTYTVPGFKTGMLDPDMGVWAYTYDPLGNLTLQVDAKGNHICYSYDQLNRLTSKFENSSASCPGTATVTYGYDFGTNGAGQRTSMTDPSGNTKWLYDNRGRMISETKTIGSDVFLTKWSYDTMDRLVTTTYPGNNTGGAGEVVTDSYNNAALLNSVAGNAPTTYVNSTTYDAAGRIDSQQLGYVSSNYVILLDNVYNAWTTSGGRLQQIKAGTSALPTSLLNLSYTYDAVGNVKTIADADVTGGTQTQTFSYDSLNRLVTAVAAGGTGGTYSTQTYGFDAIGNISSTTALGTYNYTTTVGLCGGLTVSKPHALGKAGSDVYAYDCNGNVTKRTIGTAIFTLSYDPENRLTGVVSSTLTTAFVYDGDGNRVKGTIGGVATEYLGNYYEWTGTAGVKYYYAGGERVAMQNAAGTYFLLGDQLGSTSKTANATTGAYVSELRYGPWGDTRYANGTTPTNFHYTGQRDETSLSGMYYYGARWYDNYLNRWLQPDSIVPQPGNPQSLNRYSYVLNSPINHTDPSGHKECDLDCQIRNEAVDPIAIHYDTQYQGKCWGPEECLGISLHNDTCGGAFGCVATPDSANPLNGGFKNEAAAQGAGNISSFLDRVALGFGAANAVLDAGAAVATAEDGGAGAIPMHEAVQSLEAGVSWLSTGVGFLSDVFAGRSGYDSNTTSIVIGQNTALSVVNSTAGAITQDPVQDTIINTEQVAYDAQTDSGGSQNSWGFVIPLPFKFVPQLYIGP